MYVEKNCFSKAEWKEILIELGFNLLFTIVGSISDNLYLNLQNISGYFENWGK